MPADDLARRAHEAPVELAYIGKRVPFSGITRKAEDLRQETSCRQPSSKRCSRTDTTCGRANASRKHEALTLTVAGDLVREIIRDLAKL